MEKKIKFGTRGKTKGNRERTTIFRGFLLTMLLLLSMGTMSQAAVIAKIGNKSYNSLPKAIAAVKNNQTIKLQKNVKISSFANHLYIDNNKKFTIDLNKYTITLVKSFIQIKKAKVTIKNGTVKAKDRNNPIFIVDDKGSLTIQSGKYTGEIANNGNLTIKNGTFNSGKASELIENWGTLTIKNGTFTGVKDSHKILLNFNKCTINGGKFKYQGSYYCIENLSALALNYKTAVLTITGGSFSSSAPTLIEIGSGSNVKISGGVYNGKISETITDPNGKAPKVTMTGGTVNLKTGWPISISSGTFTMKGGTVKAPVIFPERSELVSGVPVPRATAFYVTNNAVCNLQKGTITGGYTKKIDADSTLHVSVIHISLHDGGKVTCGRSLVLNNRGMGESVYKGDFEYYVEKAE